MFTIKFASLGAEEIRQLAAQKLQEDLAAWEKHIWKFLLDWFNPEIESIAVETSGSTGKPKTISHRKEYMHNSARMTCEALQLKKNSTALLCLPAQKISGMMMLVRCIEHRMNLVCIEPTVSPLLKLSDGGSIDFAAFTPMQFMDTLKDPKAFDKAENIATIILGGEGISNELMKSIRLMKNSIYATFGMTETISHSALKKLTRAISENAFCLLRGISISTDERGCMIVNAPLLGQTNLVTNDVVNLVSANEFEWLGRADNVINSGGMKLHPEMIEDLMRNQINFPFFIAAVSDSLAGQRPALVLEGDAIPLQELQQLKQYFASLDRKIQPKALWLVPKFEKTNNGKLKREDTLKTITERIDLG